MTLAKPQLKAPANILPSSLSTIRNVGTLSLHLLRREANQADAPKQAMLCCHGFGANATSYEEVMPLFLSSRLASVVLCPDQVGFGLSERPKLVFKWGMSFGVELDSLGGVKTNLATLSAAQKYTLSGNAILAEALLDSERGQVGAISSLIMGHSMGVLLPKVDWYCVQVQAGLRQRDRKARH